MTKTYDTGCYELAVKFLEDFYDPVPELHAHELAGVIQDSIENWLAGEGKGMVSKPESTPESAWEFWNNEFQKIFRSKKDAGTKSD